MCTANYYTGHQKCIFSSTYQVKWFGEREIGLRWWVAVRFSGDAVLTPGFRGWSFQCQIKPPCGCLGQWDNGNLATRTVSVYTRFQFRSNIAEIQCPVHLLKLHPQEILANNARLKVQAWNTQCLIDCSVSCVDRLWRKGQRLGWCFCWVLCLLGTYVRIHH